MAEEGITNEHFREALQGEGYLEGISEEEATEILRRVKEAKLAAVDQLAQSIRTLDDPEQEMETAFRIAEAEKPGDDDYLVGVAAGAAGAEAARYASRRRISSETTAQSVIDLLKVRGEETDFHHGEQRTTRGTLIGAMVDRMLADDQPGEAYRTMTRYDEDRERAAYGEGELSRLLRAICDAGIKEESYSLVEKLLREESEVPSLGTHVFEVLEEKDLLGDPKACQVVEAAVKSHRDTDQRGKAAMKVVAAMVESGEFEAAGRMTENILSRDHYANARLRQEAWQYILTAVLEQRDAA